MRSGFDLFEELRFKFKSKPGLKRTRVFSRRFWLQMIETVRDLAGFGDRSGF